MSHYLFMKSITQCRHKKISHNIRIFVTTFMTPGMNVYKTFCYIKNVYIIYLTKTFLYITSLSSKYISQTYISDILHLQLLRVNFK